MADPFSIAGLGLAIPGVVDLLAKTVSKMRELFSRWEDADLQLYTVSAQLGTIRATLEKIQDWQADVHAEDPSFQLIMDLNTAVAAISLLADHVDREISKFPTDVAVMTASDKARLVLASGRLGGLQNMIQHQTTALTALLAICNCKTVSEQHRLLLKKDIRQPMEVLKDDSSSLIVQRDAFSHVSQATDTLSKLSVIFSFDSTIFRTKVYQRGFRASIQSALRDQIRGKSNEAPQLRISEQTQYPNIRQWLGSHPIAFHHYCECCLDAKPYEESKRCQLGTMLFVYNQSSVGPTDFTYPWDIKKLVWFLMSCFFRYKALLRDEQIDASNRGIGLDEELYQSKWLDFSAQIECHEFAKEFAEDVESDRLHEMLVAGKLPPGAEWLLPNARRILHGYWHWYGIRVASDPRFTSCKPHIDDVTTLPTFLPEDLLASGIAGYEPALYLTLEGGSVRVSFKKVTPAKYSGPQLVDICAINLVDYLQPADDSSNSSTRLHDMLASTAQWRRQSSGTLVLVMFKPRWFGEMLQRQPFRNYFPDFDAANEPEMVADYVFKCCTLESPYVGRTKSIVLDPQSMSGMDEVYAAIKLALVDGIVMKRNLPVE